MSPAHLGQQGEGEGKGVGPLPRIVLSLIDFGRAKDLRMESYSATPTHLTVPTPLNTPASLTPTVDRVDLGGLEPATSCPQCATIDIGGALCGRFDLPIRDSSAGKSTVFLTRPSVYVLLK